MQVVPGHARVAEDHRATAVRLQPVLVRIDHHRVALGDRGVRGPSHSLGRVVGDQGEEAAVRGVDMDPGAVAAAERQGLVDGVDRPETGGAGGQHDGADRARLQQVLQRVEVHPAAGVGGHRSRGHAEQVAHPAVRVVRVGAVRDSLARMAFPGDEQRFEVGDRAAAGQVSEVRRVAEHPGQIGDHLLLHPGGRRAAVERVVVGVDQHRRQVADDRGRVRRLQHLADVARVEERVVVPQPLQQLSLLGSRTPPGRPGATDGSGYAPNSAIQPLNASIDAARRSVSSPADVDSMPVRA